MTPKRLFPACLLLAAGLAISQPTLAQQKTKTKTKPVEKKETRQEVSPSDDPLGIEPAMQPAATMVADPPTVYRVVEQMPYFNGEFNSYLAANLIYPDAARESGIEGRVAIEFIVRKDGSITDAKVVRSAGKQLDEEALRLIRAMPKWTPGKQQGKPVDVFYVLPITFKLQ